ncbi:locus delta-like isoform X2 [Octopus vulgaris]|uniref:Locus delta-like isoform X2 n=1 Tax=Octopus vulgaris TaxID=6645 RepID=A0AA36BBV8_OCTVU|nr:locus delta-like isoform X2 [Octopus vulgaris]
MKAFVIKIDKIIEISVDSVLLIICGAKAKGTAEIKLLKFVNPTGNTFYGSCCDYKGFWSFECTECDHAFKICIGNTTESSSMDTCEFGKLTTGAVKKNEIQFTSDIGGTKNPLKFSINTMPSFMKIKIDVIDQDGFGNFDFIDHYEYPIFPTNLTNQQDSASQELKLIGENSEHNKTRVLFNQLRTYSHIYHRNGHLQPDDSLSFVRFPIHT